MLTALLGSWTYGYRNLHLERNLGLRGLSKDPDIREILRFDQIPSLLGRNEA